MHPGGKLRPFPAVGDAFSRNPQSALNLWDDLRDRSGPEDAGKPRSEPGLVLLDG